MWAWAAGVQQEFHNLLQIGICAKMETCWNGSKYTAGVTNEFPEPNNSNVLFQTTQRSLDNTAACLGSAAKESKLNFFLGLLQKGIREAFQSRHIINFALAFGNFQRLPESCHCLVEQPNLLQNQSFRTISVNGSRAQICSTSECFQSSNISALMRIGLGKTFPTLNIACISTQRFLKASYGLIVVVLVLHKHYCCLAARLLLKMYTGYHLCKSKAPPCPASLWRCLCNMLEQCFCFSKLVILNVIIGKMPSRIHIQRIKQICFGVALFGTHMVLLHASVIMTQESEAIWKLRVQLDSLNEEFECIVCILSVIIYSRILLLHVRIASSPFPFFRSTNEPPIDQ